MDAENIKLKGFLERSAGTPLGVKVLQALAPLPGGQIPILAICFLFERESFAIFNHLAVWERWDFIQQREVQRDVFETIFFTAAREVYDEIEIGKVTQFTANWNGETLVFGPVQASELYTQDQAETFHVDDATIHYESHADKIYEFLTEMVFSSTGKEWRLSPIANFPLFFSLMESQ
jgi:hypothetical protein